MWSITGSTASGCIYQPTRDAIWMALFVLHHQYTTQSEQSEQSVHACTCTLYQSVYEVTIVLVKMVGIENDRRMLKFRDCYYVLANLAA